MANNLKKNSSSGTSFEEQAIYYYIKQIFPDAVNRGKYSFDESENIELDIYIPCLHFAIEYDGAYWHKDKVESDNNKNRILSDAGIYLVRVRECGLADLDKKYGDIIYRKTSPRDNGLHLQEVINEIVRIIRKFIGENNWPISSECRDLINEFDLGKDKLIEDRPDIYAQYHTSFQENNITSTCLINHWDYEKNGALLPQNVSVDSGIFIVLTCSKGHSFHVQPSRYKFKSTVDKAHCANCMLNYCPALLDRMVCPESTCDIYENAHSNAIFVSSWEKNNHQFFSKNQKIEVKSSNCTSILIKNIQPLYDKMWYDIKEKINHEHNEITTEQIFTWLISLDWFEQISFVQMIQESKQKDLIAKLKEVLSNPSNYGITIKIDEKIPQETVLELFKTYGSKRFNYPSLHYFDLPNIMQDFCNILLNECRLSNSVMSQINDVALTLGIQKEYQTLSPIFSAHLYNTIVQLEQIVSFPRSEECKKLLYPKAKGELSSLGHDIAENILKEIQACASANSKQIRYWIDTTPTPQKEQVIYNLYKKGLLKSVGDEATDKNGYILASKDLDISFISDINEQLGIMEILGIYRFKYNLKQYDDSQSSNRFINLIKKSADTDDSFLISGYNSQHLEKEILSNIDTISYDFAKQLYIMMMYLSTTVDRPYPCWYDDDPSPSLSALKKKLTGKEQRFIDKKEHTSSPLSLGIAITFPDDIREKRDAELREIEVAEKSRKEHIDSYAENYKEKLRRRSQGLCQKCGSSLRRKYFIFGESICTKCGMKKDY